MTDCIRIGSRDFLVGKHTYVMGILNLTPDSFSDGGRYGQIEEALRHGEEMIEQGADLLDIGGESTRPGHKVISEEEEIHRVVPIIRALKDRFNIPLSIDTYKAKVAREAFMAGADMLNDVWGLTYDREMAGIVKEYDAAVCLMHNRKNKGYAELLPEIMEELRQSVLLAREAGISDDKIMLDPGIGFGKSYEDNLAVLGHLKEFERLDRPMLLGASRKSVIGLTLDLPIEQREEGTMALTAMAVESRWLFVRVHDVEKNKRLIKMMEAVIHAKG